MIAQADPREDAINRILASPGMKWEDLIKIARYYGGDNNDLDDIVSEAVQKVWRSPSLLEVSGNRGKTKNYLRAALRTTVKDHWRRKTKKFQTKLVFRGKLEGEGCDCCGVFPRFSVFDTWEETCEKFCKFISKVTRDKNLSLTFKNLILKKRKGSLPIVKEGKIRILLDLNREWWYRSLEPRNRKRLSPPDCPCGKTYPRRLPSGSYRHAVRYASEGYSGHRVCDPGVPTYAPWCTACGEWSIQIPTGDGFHPLWDLA